MRSRATEWQVAPDRIGVIGFSAGAQLAALAGTHFDTGNPEAADVVERESSRPAFMALMYPAIPQERDMPLSSETPPAFLFCGENDFMAEGIANLYLTLKRAAVPVELHVLTGVGHGFGIRSTNPPAVASWPTTFYNWLAARKMVPDGLAP